MDDKTAVDQQPSLNSFAAEWPSAVRSSVLVAASQACATATNLNAASCDRWLGAVTQHLNSEAKAADHPKGDSVQDHAFEIANDLLLVSLRLLPAPPAPADSGEKPATPEPIYTAPDRLLLHNTLRELDVDLNYAHEAEKAVAQQLYFVIQAAEAQEQAEAKKAKWGSISPTSLNNKKSAWKWAATGAGFIAGGVALGVTGGLAAPLLAPLLVTASGGALAFLGTSGGVALIGSLFGLAGGGLAGARVKRRVEGIKMFSFDKIQADKDLPDM